MARILVVDDEDLIREILVQVLENMGHEVEQARSGVEALDKFDAGAHDLVLSDVMMPDMNGLDLLARLAPRSQGRVPFVILSSHDDPLSIEAAVDAGAFDYLVKPFESCRVAEVVESALAGRAGSARRP